MSISELASPERLTPAERALEIAAILTLVIVRTQADEGCSERPPDLGFSAGKRLHTMYGSREHPVRVTAEGTFEYEGTRYKSLSAVARNISGTQWSGPVYFGLKPPAKSEKQCRR